MNTDDDTGGYSLVPTDSTDLRGLGERSPGLSHERHQSREVRQEATQRAAVSPAL